MQERRISQLLGFYAVALSPSRRSTNTACPAISFFGNHLIGSVATLPAWQEQESGRADLWFLGDQPEQLSDEPNLASNIIVAHTSNLTFPNHVHRLIALKRSPGRTEFPEALLGVDPAFDRTVILLEDVVQVLDRAMATAPTKNTLLLDGRDRRGVDGHQVRFPVEEGFLHNGVLAHLWCEPDNSVRL